MTVSRSTALVPVPKPSTGMVVGTKGVRSELLLAGEDVTLRDREEVRNRLPDILGRALARSWLDPDFEEYFSVDPLGALEAGGVHLPQTMFVEVTKSVADRPKIVVYERQEGSKFKSRVLYLKLVMVAGK